MFHLQMSQHGDPNGWKTGNSFDSLEEAREAHMMGRSSEYFDATYHWRIVTDTMKVLAYYSGPNKLVFVDHLSVGWLDEIREAYGIDPEIFSWEVYYWSHKNDE